MPRSVRVIVSVLAVLVIAGAGAFALGQSNAAPDWLRFGEDDPYEFHGGFFEPPKEAHDVINAVDQNGDPFSFEDHEGKSIFVYFGYTYCPDYCPATVAEWMEVKSVLGEDAEDVVFVMVSVDPERDTPERLNQWLGFWDPEFYGVTMSEEDTAEVARNWGITATKRESGSQSGYLVDHEISSFVIDPDGHLRLTFPLGFEPEDIADDVRHLNQQD